MGNREDLLAGAKQCLLEKGYLRTTARDISAASGVSLAGIGYHFGSKEALMNQALFEAIGEFGDTMESALAVDSSAAAGSLERFEAVWTQVIASVAEHRRLWVASFEPIALLDHLPEIREFFAMGAQHSRTGLAALFLGTSEDEIDEATARTLGSFYYALMVGMITQWLSDPERAPTGRDLADALRIIAARLDPGPADQAGAADQAPAAAAADGGQ